MSDTPKCPDSSQLDAWAKAASKSAPDLSKLDWQTPDGVTVKPLYTRRDVEGLPYADTLPGIIQEMLLATTSERQGRIIDFDSSASMEKKKQEGYF